MITKNTKSFDLTLKAFSKKQEVGPMVIKEDQTTTLISEDKTLYFCLDSKIKINKLKSVISKFVNTNKYDLNIDIDSFVNLFENKKEVFQTIVETLMFENHQPYNLKEKECIKESYNLLFGSDYDELYENSLIKMEYLNFARDLQDMPPNLATSVDVADIIVNKAKDIPNINIKVYGKKEAQDYGMGLFLAVNAGSYVDPRIVVLEYVGESNAKRTALVGKGITFDSGGYNLKNSQELQNMKFDMSGAAIVCSTVMALAKANAKCNIVAVAMLTDNRIGGHATLSESVFKSMNGKTVEITDTDAEGRLVLADGITFAIRELKAERVVTIATLTLVIFLAFGIWHTGVFSTCDSFYKTFETASKKAGEMSWRLPLLEEHYEVMECSNIADVANCEISKALGGKLCTPTAFLNAFAEEKPYIHLDIANTADFEGRGKAPMLRTLFELFKNESGVENEVN
ncbi:leucyl aminopeptidase [Spiroplasma helicoides]|uniref:Probable cytosol aminopeptidase n=1 Tax=Spiroplasma helicoides TaxID=216938 RepID=A0A1B3SM84_9MOLU|nr:M17 family metallopeptidase [Spiroplasma helicoides]AOG61027.1 leucyl aminopeptidase [Spiroplasma helicoides]